MIKVENIDKYFNRFKKSQIHVINNTSLEFNEKGLVALLGTSGSGKTTLLNVIGGLDKVRRGNIYINGKKITHRLQSSIDKTRNLNIGYIFQDYKLIENETVYDNVALVLKMIGIKDKKEIEKRVLYVLDRVGMLRYKKRPCNMLSGGERQRVGIARAIVKNPNIIIADEPTGNLDSKNSVEIMNIIKAISKDKLVILVTHEQNLAKFYASRIIELEDGKIIKDYQNNNDKDLDYEISNILYLQDYKNKYNYNDKVRVYSNEENNLKLNIVVTNNNIYIETKDNRKIEVVDDTSSIEMIDDHYKNISKEDMNKYKFDYDKIINNPKKIKYSSIFNPISFITNGFSKVINYSLLKKILLIGFFISGAFIMYASCSIYSNMLVDDTKFLTINKDYLIIDSKKIKVEDYNNIENRLKDNINYMLPSDSTIKLNVKINDFYQTNNATVPVKGSLTDLNLITKKDIFMGRMPENSHEIVVDKSIIDKVLKENSAKMVGAKTIDKFLNRDVSFTDMKDFKIVGITNFNNPTIYIDPSEFVNVLYHADNSEDNDLYMAVGVNQEIESSKDMDDFNLYRERIDLKEGNEPVNDYETVVNISHKEEYPKGKEIFTTINKHKLKVVGYYESREQLDIFLVNNNMIKTKVILSSSDISIYPKNKEEVIKTAQEELNLNIKDSYKSSKDKYIKERHEAVTSAIITASIIIAISLIEILLMIRSSFLSRIKEVGIYRAIGIKKKDIYIMFSGEIIAITTLAAVPGIILCAYILNILSKISYLKEYIILNPIEIVYSIILVYVFNLVVGLIPVFNTIRKRPAEILSRTDI